MVVLIEILRILTEVQEAEQNIQGQGNDLRNARIKDKCVVSVKPWEGMMGIASFMIQRKPQYDAQKIRKEKKTVLFCSIKHYVFLL